MTPETFLILFTSYKKLEFHNFSCFTSSNKQLFFTCDEINSYPLWELTMLTQWSSDEWWDEEILKTTVHLQYTYMGNKLIGWIKGATNSVC